MDQLIVLYLKYCRTVAKPFEKKKPRQTGTGGEGTDQSVSQSTDIRQVQPVIFVPARSVLPSLVSASRLDFDYLLEVVTVTCTRDVCPDVRSYRIGTIDRTSDHRTSTDLLSCQLE